MSSRRPGNSVRFPHHAIPERRDRRQAGCPAPHNQPLKATLRSTGDPVKNQSWKPATLRPPLLVSVVALTLSFIAILESLSEKSRIDGGIAFTESRFSSSLSFGYLYLPTILAVLYSILWSWIDLDTKRLEPWFQLSRPGGAKAVDSMLLHYPFDFVAFAPLKALRRR